MKTSHPLHVTTNHVQPFPAAVAVAKYSARKIHYNLTWLFFRAFELASTTHGTYFHCKIHYQSRLSSS